MRVQATTKPRRVVKRNYCEDMSPTLRAFRKSKHHGKIITLNGLVYERIGDEFFYCFKTSSIKNLEDVGIVRTFTCSKGSND
jgi:hypothetical protein